MLDYEPAKRTYQPTPEDERWRIWRFVYYAALWLICAFIAWQPGPNLFLFRSVFSPPLSHYAALTKDYTPIIAAIKAYQSDTGKLPMASWDLPRAYQPVNDHYLTGNIWGTTTITFGMVEYSVLEYDFNPLNEGWRVYAPRYYGPIPASIVLAAPSPTTRASTTQPFTNNK